MQASRFEEPLSTADGERHARMGRLARGATVSLAGRVGGGGIRYLTQLLLAWTLGAAGFGVYTLGAGVYQLAELFARLGLATGSVRFVSTFRRLGDSEGLKGTLIDAFRLPLLAGVVIGAALVLLAPQVAVGVFDEPALIAPLRIFAIAIPLGAVMNTLAFATTGFQTTSYMVWIIHIISPASNMAILVLLLPGGVSVMEATAAWTASLGASAAAGVLLTSRLWPRVWEQALKTRFETRRLVKASLPLVAGDFLWVALIWVDVLMLGVFEPADTVGVYRAASQTALLLSIVGFALSSMLAPISADLHAGGERGALRHTYQVSTRWQVSSVLPLFVVVAIAGGDLLRLFGPDFPAGYVALVILAGAQLVSAFTGGGGAILVMAGHEMLKLYTDVAAAVLNVVLNLILIPRFGILGAAVATGTSISCAFLLRVALLAWRERLSPFSLLLVRPIAASAVAFGGGWLVTRAGMDALLPRLGLTVGAVAITYAVVLVALGLPREERELIGRLAARFRNAKAPGS